MSAQTRISVPMTQDELTRLLEVSRRELRHPRDQARYMLRSALGLTDQEKHNGAVMNFGETHGAVAAVAE